VAKDDNSPPDLAASTLTIRQLFALGQFEPARAQRDYQWEEPQWRALLTDLTAAFTNAGLDPDEGKGIEDDPNDKGPAGIGSTGEPIIAPPPSKRMSKRQPLSSYYLGHMLLQPRQRVEGFYIYDGQQRLTTLTLMLCALRDTPGGLEVWDTIQRTVRTPPPDNKPRLVNPTSGGALTHILKINGINARVAAANFEAADRRMYKAARFFLANTQDWSPARWRAFTDFLLDRVDVTVTRAADRRLLEFAYVTINTRGKPLETKDIIKGHFSHLASRHGLTASNRMNEKWDQLERRSGNNLEQILRTAFLLDFRQKPAFDFAPQLMDHFEEDRALADAEDWVGHRLPKVADLYNGLVAGVFGHDVLRAPEADLRRLTFLPWKHWQAIAFAFAERDAKAPLRFEKSIKGLTRWAFILNLIDVDDDWILNIATEAIAQIQEKRDPFEYRDHGALRVSAKWRKRAIARLQDGQIADRQRRGAHVRWTETLYSPPDEIDFRATDDTSVDHVLPKRCGGQWLRDFPVEQHIYAEKFGNLCLLPKDVNVRLFDGQYQQKRPIILQLPPHYRSAHEVAQYEVWNAAAVDERTRQLAERAAKALQLI
jgi:hypothetical protein